MDTDSFIAYIKSDNINKHNVKDVQQGMALPIMNETGHFLKEEIKKKKVEKSVLKRTKYENYKMNSKESIKKNRLILKIQKVFRS